MQGEHAVPDADLATQREVVEAFLAAGREGDFEALVAVLDPDVVLRADGGAAFPHASALVRGARDIAGRAMAFDQPSPALRPALVNGLTGVLVTVEERPFAIMAFNVSGDKIVEVYVMADPQRLPQLNLAAVE